MHLDPDPDLDLNLDPDPDLDLELKSDHEPGSSGSKVLFQSLWIGTRSSFRGLSMLLMTHGPQVKLFKTILDHFLTCPGPVSNQSDDRTNEEELCFLFAFIGFISRLESV